MIGSFDAWKCSQIISYNFRFLANVSILSMTIKIRNQILPPIVSSFRYKPLQNLKRTRLGLLNYLSIYLYIYMSEIWHSVLDIPRTFFASIFIWYLYFKNFSHFEQYVILYFCQFFLYYNSIQVVTNYQICFIPFLLLK